MKLSDWLFLAAFILLGICLGMFSRFPAKLKVLDACARDPRPYALLCEEKIPLSTAQPHDFARLQGISLKTARLAVQFLRENPERGVDDLVMVKGIGPKTVRALHEFFRD